MNNKFYVYALLDPRKRGQFYYINLPFSFLFEPFYIGKGNKNRYHEHSWRKVNKTVANKISEINNTGLKFIPIKIYKNLSNEEALIRESETIEKIGRALNQKGPLLNITTGGLTPTDYFVSEETKKKIKLNNARFWKGKKRSQEVLNKLSQSKKLAYRMGFVHPMLGKKANKAQLKGLNQTGRKWTTEQKLKLKKRRPFNALSWEIISPEGKIYKTNRFYLFCLKHNLNQGHMHEVGVGKRKHHKGWKCKKRIKDCTGLD